ncbi:nucleotide-diphospho-sugar transferase domain-containing protein [Cordyceps javanica]|uniref:Nucleotide-diphospho-sugar transferase domain-containing protein n=1 Tax=Cordyceps javanica TaxID=43265 RepID=A0A545UZB1_9HYPO|nr:nucleotide-diphospho-sugar transferase domain-containing protein [Cordyceps javanica]TQW06677.1 nucleotide-diphospho-sugar transferase domain-containing protein [Cordyceps javanica]
MARSSVSRRVRMGIVACTICICFAFYHLYTSLPATANLHVSRLTRDDVHTLATHAIDNTVVVVPVNTGMLHLAENLLCSLSATSFNTSAIVFWSLDEGAQRILAGRGHATYRDASLFSASGDENARGATAAYRRMMRQRPLFFRDVLSLGFDVLMIDADLVFWQSPLAIVPARGGDPADRDGVDAVYSTDARDFYTDRDAFADAGRRGALVPPICNGLFWMKGGRATAALWSEVLAVFEAPWWRAGLYRHFWFQDDQRGVDVLLNDGRARLVAPLPRGITPDMVPNRRRGDDGRARLGVRLLDQAQAVNGQLFMFREASYRDNLARLRAEGGDRISAHMNWNTHLISKTDGAKKKGIYFLDDDGNCKYAH